MNEFNLMTYINSLFTVFKSAYYVPIAFCQFFTWIALGDVDVCFSLIFRGEGKSILWRKLSEPLFGGVTVTSFSVSLLQERSSRRSSMPSHVKAKSHKKKSQNTRPAYVCSLSDVGHGTKTLCCILKVILALEK